MKVRTGFVSNSSSSSFIALVRKQDYQNILNNLSPLAAAVAEYLSTDSTFCGIDCVLYSHMDGNCSWTDYADFDSIKKNADSIAASRGLPKIDWDDEDDFYDNVFEAASDFDSAAIALGSNSFVHTEDF